MRITKLLLAIITISNFPFLLSAQSYVSSFRQTSDYGYKQFEIEGSYRYAFEVFRKVGQKSTDYEFIFSGNSYNALKLCDTNAVVYTSVEKDYSYLIVTILSPTICTDTLFVISKNENPVFPPMTNEFKFSFRDSLLALPEGDRFPDKVCIYKSLSTNKYKKLYQIDGGYEVSLCGDFTQFYISKRVVDENSHVLGRGEIAIYDIVLDTLSYFSSEEHNLSNGRRWNRDSPLYYLKDNGKDEKNIWNYSASKTDKLVFSPKWPEYVQSFTLWRAYISARIGNYETSVQFGKSIVIPLSD